MYAIIEESGGQRQVSQGDEILVDLLDAKANPQGSSITFKKVLVVGEVGGAAKIGQPYVAGASVSAQVLESEVKGEKVYIQKFREKKAWRKKTGHRQKYSLVKVTAING